MKNPKGFTLIELLLVLAIIGIISAIAIPALLGQRENARNKATASNAAALVSAIQVAADICENPDYTPANTRPVTDLGLLAQYPSLAAIFGVVMARAQVAAVMSPFDNTVACYNVATGAPTVRGTVGWVTGIVLGQSQGTVSYVISVAGVATVRQLDKVVETALAP